MPTQEHNPIASILSLGGETAKRNHAQFSADLTALLRVSPDKVTDFGAWRTALTHGFASYYWRWDKRAIDHMSTVEKAIAIWSKQPTTDLNLLCELLDFHYFLCWCFHESSTEQCRHAMGAMRTAAEAFARGAKIPPRLPQAERTIHVAWLAMFATADNPMSVSLRHIVPALRRHGDRFRLTVVAWREVQPSFIDWLRDQGVTCHVPVASSPAETIQSIEAAIAADPAAIAISDMNNAVPTALFARRLAPAQMFLQAGMPVWPVRPLDGVLNCFGFDPDLAGWGKARLFGFLPPWDLDKLNPLENIVEVEEQRDRLPKGMRLIGNFGRLVKVTEPCLRAAEQILLQCPDVAFVTGGTGDATAIRAFIKRSIVGDRMHVVEGYVPGHSWGRLLDVFLDTWPVTGGESCREMIAKRRPVVTMRSAEMPAILEERESRLVANTWTEYSDMVVRLLRDSQAYAAACDRAFAFAQSRTAHAAFADRVKADFEQLLDDVRARPPELHNPPRSRARSGLWTAICRYFDGIKRK